MQTYQNLYHERLPWIHRYNHKDVSYNLPQFHYYTKDQPGFLKVRLHVIDNNYNECDMDMYYEEEDIDFSKLTLASRQDDSPLADLSQLLPPDPLNIQISRSQLSGKSLWVQKHMPTTYSQLLTDEYLNRTVMKWVKAWDPVVFRKKGNKAKTKSFPLFGYTEQAVNENEEVSANYKLLLLAGPPGCGKTTLARIVAKHCGYQYVEINASDSRTSKSLVSKIEEMANNESVVSNGKPTLIILDEVDGIVDTQANGIKDVLNYIETGEIPGENKKKANKNKKGEEGLFIKRPILFICNDPYTKGLKELRSKARVLNFHKIRTEKIAQGLRRICTKEDVEIAQEDIVKICELNQNDMRSAVSMLQYISKQTVLGLTPREILKRVVWQKKENAKTLVQFLEDVLVRKNSSMTMDYREVQNSLMSVDTTTKLLLQAFYSNYKNCKAIYRNFGQVPMLQDAICQSDVIINNSFHYNFQLNGFLSLPYAFYKIHFRNEQGLKLEYPYQFFQRLNKEKTNKYTVQKFIHGLDAQYKPFISSRKALLDYIPALNDMIQPRINEEKEIIRCLKLMISYGVEFSQGTNFITPQIDKLFVTMEEKQPQSDVIRTTMSSHYKDVKQNLLFESQGIQPRQVNLKKQRVRPTAESIQYKFLEGTGTQIQYQISLKYFI